MGNWRWEGINKSNKKVSGVMDAENARTVRKSLRSQGIRPLRVKPPGIGDLDLNELMISLGISSAFSKKELSNFTRQLSTMINAGVPILQSMEIFAKQEKNPFFKKILKKIISDVAGGKALFEALRGAPGFDNLYCNLVKAGEAGGILDEILMKLVEFMDKQEKIKSQIKGAMTYPIIVVCVGVAVVAGLLTFVVPKFVDMLTQSNQEIPAVTQFVIDTSEFLQRYGLYCLGAGIVGFFLFKKWAQTPRGKLIFDKYLMKTPIFGGIVIKGNLASFCRTLATMLGSGVPLLDSLAVCRETLSNDVMVRDIEMIRKEIENGKTFVQPLKRITYFPEMVAQMIQVGESTGNMDQMLLKVADIFERELEELISTMTKMIEPLILVGLGGVVGLILIAMYLPIFMSAGGA